MVILKVRSMAQTHLRCPAVQEGKSWKEGNMRQPAEIFLSGNTASVKIVFADNDSHHNIGYLPVRVKPRRPSYKLWLTM